MTYKGYTIEQIKSFVDYDPESGVFKSKKTGKELVGRDFSYREDGSSVVTKFQLSRLAVMITSGLYLGDEDRVVHKDKDPYNYKRDNLVVVSVKEAFATRTNDPVNRYLETEYEHVFVGTMNKLFVVRRGPKQAIYRTYDKDEAVAVRDRWLESGKTLHELDAFCPKWYKKMVNQVESE